MWLSALLLSLHFPRKLFYRLPPELPVSHIFDVQFLTQIQALRSSSPRKVLAQEKGCEHPQHYLWRRLGWARLLLRLSWGEGAGEQRLLRQQVERSEEQRQATKLGQGPGFEQQGSGRCLCLGCYLDQLANSRA